MVKKIIIMGCLALVILSYFCISAKSPIIENDLLDRSHAALTNENISWTNISIDGRELLLTGVAPSEELREKVTDTVKSVWGVRTVDNQLTVAEPNISEPEISKLKKYSLMIAYSGSSIVLEGVVADQITREMIVETAQSYVGASNVTNKLIVESGAPFYWGDSIKQAVFDQINKYSDMTAHFQGTRLTISGSVAPDTSIDQLKHRISSSLLEPYALTEFNVQAVSDMPPVVSVEAAKDCQNLFNNLLLNQKIYFETARSEIKHESEVLLKELSLIALTCPDAKIKIIGHTDSSGSSSMNQKLSEQRALSVVQDLMKKGINANRLEAIGYGETKPIVDNKTAENKAKNRRIEFIVIGD
ncbi:Outer membrane protein A precursor [hydrothermal vent metagenome]|uniref:Outer membrane protein A n=1 Tax=hydrothermal vent metagenome TaxID=652676 RepID=A0A3B0WKZ3_9ZZZZ